MTHNHDAILNLIHWYGKNKKSIFYKAKQYSQADARQHAIISLVSIEYQDRYGKQMMSDDKDKILKIADEYGFRDDMALILEDILKKKD